MTETLTLTDFLLARIAEDEAEARTCPPWPWRVATIEDEAAAHDEQTYAGETVSAADGICVAAPYALSGAQTRAVRDHIARHDPARVLAECEAKRRIVEDAATYADEFENEAYRTEDQTTAGRGAGRARSWRDDILRALSQPHADHPDYRAEWRP